AVEKRGIEGGVAAGNDERVDVDRLRAWSHREASARRHLAAFEAVARLAPGPRRRGAQVEVTASVNHVLASSRTSLRLDRRDAREFPATAARGGPKPRHDAAQIHCQRRDAVERWPARPPGRVAALARGRARRGEPAQCGLRFTVGKARAALTMPKPLAPR